MAISERSYVDRFQRGQELHSAIVGFTPAFAPADANLLPAVFEVFLDTIDHVNTEVETLAGQYTTGVEQRTPLVADIKERSARALEYVKSNGVWKAFVPALKRSVDKVRGNVRRKPTVPAPGEEPGPPPANKRSQGERSFSDIEENFERLIAGLDAVPDYAPPAAALSVASLTTLANDFASRNLAMSTLSNQLGMKQKERLELYDGPGGLRDKMKAIKSSVRSQYGTNSAEYGQVKGIGV